MAGFPARPLALEAAAPRRRTGCRITPPKCTAYANGITTPREFSRYWYTWNELAVFCSASLSDRALTEPIVVPHRDASSPSGFHEGSRHLPADMTLTCRDCSQAFTFTTGEQDFYTSRGFSEPSRCADCRAAAQSPARWRVLQQLRLVFRRLQLRRRCRPRSARDVQRDVLQLRSGSASAFPAQP